MRIVAISDTHQQHNQITVPDGDILVHAGDWTNQGTLSAMRQFLEWFSAQPHPLKVFIPGNHEITLEAVNKKSAFDLIGEYTNDKMHFLLNSSANIAGLRWFGAPSTPFYGGWAFNFQRGPDIAAEWAKIPDDVEVLITHGPPYGIQDLVEDNWENVGRDLHQGCEDLRARIKSLKNLKLHIYGHLHFGYGIQVIDNIQFVNAAICTEKYQPTNKPIVIDLE